MEEKAMNPEPPSISSDDTKEFVLYVYKGEANSMDALDLLRKNAAFSNRCAVKNIATLPDIPAFLQGVPTLYIKKTNLVLCGSKALKSITEQQKSQLKPMGMAQQSNYTPAPGGKESVKKYNAGKVTDDALKLFMERRNQ